MGNREYKEKIIAWLLVFFSGVFSWLIIIAIFIELFG